MAALSLPIDPMPFLLKSRDAAVEYFTRRDLLDVPVAESVDILSHPVVAKLLRGQHRDGSWGKFGGYPAYHCPMVESFKRLRLLIGRYEMGRSNPAIEAGADFLFSTQTERGDFRGMIGDQYATYYTGEFAALLIRAGYADDPRVDLALRWLLSMRQSDGGWTIPILTRPCIGKSSRELTGAPAEPVEPDRTKPFSHNWTDMVLRGFVAHPRWRERPEVLQAAKLLKSRFFKSDTYRSYGKAAYWVRFIHWWPNLLTALESLSELRLTVDEPDVAAALEWFRKHQEPDGSWRTTYFPGNKVNPGIEKTERPWVTLRIARLFKRFGC